MDSPSVCQLMMMVFLNPIFYLLILILSSFSYDSDYNHAPCLRYGHKAHWALVIGYLIDHEDEVNVVCIISFANHH